MAVLFEMIIYLIKRSGYSQSCSANSLQVPHFLIRRAALRIRKYGTWRLFAEQRLANHSTALFCAWAEALLGVECVVVFFAAGRVIFFPINAPGMGRFKLFDLVGYS